MTRTMPWLLALTLAACTGAADAAKVRAILFEEARIGAKVRIISWILFSAYGFQCVPK